MNKQSESPIYVASAMIVLLIVLLTGMFFYACDLQLQLKHANQTIDKYMYALSDAP